MDETTNSIQLKVLEMRLDQMDRNRTHPMRTNIYATDVACNLRRLPAAFYIVVETNGGEITQTSNKPVLASQDAVEWDEEIFLPTARSSVISFSVYAAFELGPRFGSGELIRHFEISVGEILDHNERLQPIKFLMQEDDIFPSCSSLKIVAGRHVCDTNHPSIKSGLLDSNAMNQLEQLTDEGQRALTRYRQLQNQRDLDEAITRFERVQELCFIDHPNRSAVLFNLANAKFIDCQANDRYYDLDVPIELYRNALRLRTASHPDHFPTVLALCFSLLARFQRRGEETDRLEVTNLLRGVVEATPVGSHANRAGHLALQMTQVSAPIAMDIRVSQVDPEDVIQSLRDTLRNLSPWDPCRPTALAKLGTLLYLRFQRNEDLADIHEAIAVLEYATQHTSDSDPNKTARLKTLANSLYDRFKRLGNLTDINKSISVFEETLHLIPEGHPDKLCLLNNLGNALSGRSERTGDLADTIKSISVLEEVIRLTPDDHLAKPGQLSNLGVSLFQCFAHHGRPVDIERSILMFEDAIRLTPDGQPAEKAGRLNNLGNALARRFEYLGDIADVHKSVPINEEAVHLMPTGHPAKPSLLSNLGNSLLTRFEHLGDLADIDKSISMLEEAVQLTPDGHPGRPGLLSSLGKALSGRFKRLGDLADIDESILVKEEAISLTPDDHPDKPGRLGSLGYSLFRRYELLDHLPDIEKSISITDQAIHLTPDGHPGKPSRLSNLGSSLLCRFERLRDLADIERSISVFEEAIHLTPDHHPEKAYLFNDLGNSLSRRFEYLCDIADIDKSITMREEAVRHTPEGHSNRLNILNNLGSSLLDRFERFGDIEDINQSISISEEVVRLTPDGHPDKPSRLCNLGNAFMTRFKHSHDPDDLSAAVSQFSTASRAPTGPISTRFYGARLWISSVQLQVGSHTHPLLDAYATAIALLPQLAWFGFPLKERHRVLAEAAHIARDAAAAALDAGFPEMAVEWLEQGRSIVWNQLLQLRTPVDDLRVEHPALADQFEQVSRLLEHSGSGDNHLVAEVQTPEKEYKMHHDLALRREKLLIEIRSFPGFEQFLLPKTIKQLAPFTSSGPVVYLNASKQRCDALIIHAGSSSVVSAPLLDVSYRDVEVMNCLLLKRDYPTISNIWTADGISELKLSVILKKNATLSEHSLNMLLRGDDIECDDREGGPLPEEIDEYSSDDRIFHHVLRFLWKRVVNPVLVSIGMTAPPPAGGKIPRIFWCPTGPFAFLPIHAAGLYRGTSPAGTKLSEFAVSSYIPTLSALIPSTEKDTNGAPSTIRLVNIPQPPKDGRIKLLGVKEEIDYIETLSANSPFVILQNSQGTVEDVMAKMANSDWVHFACHGIQDPSDPLDSGLCLKDHRRLKLSDIIQLSRPQGGLAFLSACQTAQGDEVLPEESVHLAAGMLLAGYGGVIATMWTIRDRDAPKVAGDVYGYLFRDGKVPDSTEAAEALHYAVQRLCDSGASFSSWVPFIHVGR